MVPDPMRVNPKIHGDDGLEAGPFVSNLLGLSISRPGQREIDGYMPDKENGKGYMVEKAQHDESRFFCHYRTFTL